MPCALPSPGAVGLAKPRTNEINREPTCRRLDSAIELAVLERLGRLATTETPPLHPRKHASAGSSGAGDRRRQRDRPGPCPHARVQGGRGSPLACAFETNNNSPLTVLVSPLACSLRVRASRSLISTRLPGRNWHRSCATRAPPAPHSTTATSPTPAVWRVGWLGSTLSACGLRGYGACWLSTAGASHPTPFRRPAETFKKVASDMQGLDFVCNNAGECRHEPEQTALFFSSHPSLSPPPPLSLPLQIQGLRMRRIGSAH